MGGGHQMWDIVMGGGPVVWAVKEFTQGRTKEKFIKYTERERRQAGQQRRDYLPWGSGGGHSYTIERGSIGTYGIFPFLVILGTVSGCIGQLGPMAMSFKESVGPFALFIFHCSSLLPKSGLYVKYVAKFLLCFPNGFVVEGKWGVGWGEESVREARVEKQYWPKSDVKFMRITRPCTSRVISSGGLGSKDTLLLY